MFGDMIRRERKSRGHHQFALAAAITKAGAPTHQSSVSEWERGARRPTLLQWKALVEVMEWTPGEARQVLDALVCVDGGQ